ncbi:hypothetical protein AGLY_010798 [Aphis glycines]|uniref:Uncharacterized protein n=1 Tax=Aphis glycines TaxID=307491 RepID=A0A6G0TEK4_APHGL|nr:hypothetical protein AGLY_010798 [Aphis glycines]
MTIKPILTSELNNFIQPRFINISQMWIFNLIVGGFDDEFLIESNPDGFLFYFCPLLLRGAGVYRISEISKNYKNKKLHVKSAALVCLDFLLFKHKSKVCVLLMLLVVCIQFIQRMMNAFFAIDVFKKNICLNQNNYFLLLLFEKSHNTFLQFTYTIFDKTASKLVVFFLALPFNSFLPSIRFRFICVNSLLPGQVHSSFRDATLADSNALYKE